MAGANSWSATSAPPQQSDADARVGLLRVAKGVVVFVYAVVLVNLVLLGLGFILQLFGASIDAAFTRWVYRNVERIMEPFRGMFPSQELSDQSVLDVSLLFAMIVYTVVGIALHASIAWLTDKIVMLRRRQGAALQSGRPGEPATPAVGSPVAPPRQGASYR